MSPLSSVTLPWGYLPFTSKNNIDLFNKSKIDQGIQLTLRALDEDYRGDSDVALDVYFEALNCMFEALPLGCDNKRNKLINHKFTSLLARKFESLNQPPLQSQNLNTVYFGDEVINLNNNSNSKLRITEIETEDQSTPLSQKFVNAAVASAVALKQSPIPDAICYTVDFTLRKAQAIDKYIGVQSLCWQVSKVGLTKAIELDAQYNLHEKVSHAFMTSAAAMIKAGIAYQEAASYRELKRDSFES